MNINQIEKLKRNPNFVLQIISNIEKNIKRSVTNIEEDRILTYVNDIPNSYFQKYTLYQIQNIIETNILDVIFSKYCEINNVNTHEILKQTITSPNHVNTFKEKKIKEKIGRAHV